MAREHGRILVRIWRDEDWRQRSPDAQRLYLLLLSQRDVNNAGVMPLAVGRWARGSAGTSADDIEAALKELEQHQYVLVDRDTDEVLIRSFIRNDGITKQPQMLRSALREARATESEALRRRLGDELRRVSVPTGKGYDGVPEALADAVVDLRPNPSSEGVTAPATAPATDPSGDGVNPPPSSLGEPTVGPQVGDGEGKGERSCHVGDQLGGRASAREAAASSASGGPPPTDLDLSQDPIQPCGRSHDPERSCRRCGEVRRAAEQATRDAETAHLEARRAARETERRCPMCVEGWIEAPESGAPIARCDHVTDHRQQVADARGEVS